MKKKSVKRKPMKSAKYICVLQRGWVFVGDFSQEKDQCKLTNASCIRRWGTSMGLGELATKGPLPETILELTPEITYHQLTECFKIKCSDKWR